MLAVSDTSMEASGPATIPRLLNLRRFWGQLRMEYDQTILQYPCGERVQVERTFRWFTFGTTLLALRQSKLLVPISHHQELLNNAVVTITQCITMTGMAGENLTGGTAILMKYNNDAQPALSMTRLSSS